jgi:hypothetical protein
VHAWSGGSLTPVRTPIPRAPTRRLRWCISFSSIHAASLRSNTLALPASARPAQPLAQLVFMDCLEDGEYDQERRQGGQGEEGRRD